MKILHVVNDLGLGGIQTMLVNIVNKQSLYADVYVLVINDLYSKELVDLFSPNVKIVYNKRPVGSKSPLHLIRLNYHALRIRPDVIHLHNTVMWRYLIHPLIRRPFFVTVHDVYNKETPFQCINKFKTVFAISESVRQSILEHSGKESVVVENGILVDGFKKRSLKKKTIHRFVQVSRLETQRKGQHLLMKALDIFHSRHPEYEFTLDFIGDGSSRGMLEKTASEMKWADKIHFLGSQSQTYLYENLCNYDLVIQPSLFEGFGLTIAEAMAAQVPVLIADNDGPMKIIENGKFGQFFKCGDADDCASKIESIVYNDFPGDVVEKAHEHVRINYDISNTARAYYEYYSKAL